MSEREQINYKLDDLNQEIDAIEGLSIVLWFIIGLIACVVGATGNPACFVVVAWMWVIWCIGSVRCWFIHRKMRPLELRAIELDDQKSESLNGLTRNG